MSHQYNEILPSPGNELLESSERTGQERAGWFPPQVVEDGWDDLTAGAGVGDEMEAGVVLDDGRLSISVDEGPLEAAAAAAAVPAAVGGVKRHRRGLQRCGATVQNIGSGLSLFRRCR